MAQDVYKILKDLELKAVGLDPQTNKMQEGYFVSYRDVGLPIHKSDYDNPWSPTDSNLEQDIKEVAPVDPKKAPKTGSSTLDTVATAPSASEAKRIDPKALAGAIGESQMAYLNTFLLTDDKLVLNNQYNVIPGSSKVSDSWFAIINGASGIPTTTQPSDDLKAALDAARAVLIKDGNPTPEYKAYKDYEEKYKDKKKAWDRAYAEAATDPTKLENWPNTGVDYEDDANEAMQDWTDLGFKQQIEQATTTLAAQGIDPSMLLIVRSKQRFQNSLNEFQGVGQIPYTILEPSSWYDRDNDDGWTEYTSDDFHSETHETNSSTSYSGGGGFFDGFWGGGGSSSDQNRHDLKITTDQLEVSFKYCIVDIKRPWLDTSLLNLSNWYLTGDYKKNCISDGTMSQALPDSGETTFLPSIVTSFILIKDLKIYWSTYEDDQHKFSEDSSGSVSFGWGCFGGSASYSHHDDDSDFVANFSDEGLQVAGIQLIGYISAINPPSPAVDSSDFMTTTQTAAQGA